MKNKKSKIKTKAMALAICMTFLTAISGAIPVSASTQAQISIDEDEKIEIPDFDVDASPLVDAIEKGTTWLASNQNPDGSWGTQWQVAKTALVVLKFETQALELGFSPFDPTYKYSNEVETGLDYIFANAHITDVSIQTHSGVPHNPDTDGDGVGVYFVTPKDNLPI